MTSAPKTQIAIEYHFLVIGYGNEQQGDNAVGPWVARAVADWQLPSVQAIAIPHLLPELALEIAKANHVIFVDACTRTCAQAVQINPLVGCPQPGTFSINAHSCDPCTLLTLTQTLYGHYPRAWLLQVATDRFDEGCQLSETADHGCDRALQTIEQFFTTYQRPQWLHPESTDALMMN